MTESGRNRRQNVRLLGPFDGRRPGLFDMQLQIYDLSIGGCFVNSVHDPPHKGQTFSIHIELPNGETLVAKGETASIRPGFGYGVRFTELTDENRVRLENALEDLQTSGALQD
jgi:PilZ domain-containing protein